MPWFAGSPAQLFLLPGPHQGSILFVGSYALVCRESSSIIFGCDGFHVGDVKHIDQMLVYRSVLGEASLEK